MFHIESLIAVGLLQVLSASAFGGDLRCQCVPYYQCKNGSVITDGENLLNPRRDSETDIPLNSRVQPPYCGGSNSIYVCCRVPGNLTERPYKPQCGKRRANGVDKRILSVNQDDATEFGEWPWQGAVLNRDDGEMEFECACVLIDGTHALTVAHCVSEYRHTPGKLVARFGVWDAQAKKEALPHQDMAIARITIHPNYNKRNLKNDLALLKFNQSVKYAPNVDTVCLPKFNETFTGKTCVVTGWGKNAWGGRFSRYLRKVQLPVLNNTYCQALLRENSRLGPFYKLDQSFVCAGGKTGQDACKGDGGGPLVCYRRNGTYALAGLVSWGIECGQTDVPGVYVNVPLFLAWIVRTTGIPIGNYWPRR